MPALMLAPYERSVNAVAANPSALLNATDQILLIEFSQSAGRQHSCRSAPSIGVSLAAATETKAVGVREAVNFLTSKFHEVEIELPFRASFASRWQFSPNLQDRVESLAHRAAWNLVSVWCLAQSSGELPDRCSLVDAETWFRGGVEIPRTSLSALLPPDVLWRAQQALLSVPLNSDFWDLFPYVLEEHGPGSRASVMRDPSTARARDAKRRAGVFYTPSDVADYMVRHAMENYTGPRDRAKCLDPACGSGVFLLALCRAAASWTSASERFDCFHYVTNSLYGCDISGHAVDAATFVLLKECLSDVRRHGLSPWTAWHTIRLNLTEIDSTILAPSSTGPALDQRMETEARETLRARLASSRNEWVEPVQAHRENAGNPDTRSFGLFGKRNVSLANLFPENAAGFDLLVGNPPYAFLGRRADYDLLAADYQSLTRAKGNVRENLFPLFIEMMWRLTVPRRSTAALVTPLSIAFHGGSQHEDCRNAMYWHGGRWQFAFFDREPHALFGEEVKARNAILFRFESSSTPTRGEPAEIETGPLRKWTSRTRQELFASIDFTPLDTANITFGIPKLKGVQQACAFTILRKRLQRLPGWCNRISSCEPADAGRPARTPRVFVGGTAYNFLNVYRSILLNEAADYPLSESSIHCFELRSEKDAQAVFAILSSRLEFWLWHVLGDGFHVAAWLWDEVPFARSTFTNEAFDRLAELGASLWSELQSHQIVSVNGGKRTIAFRPLACNHTRDAIDAILVDAGGCPRSLPMN